MLLSFASIMVWSSILELIIPNGWWMKHSNGLVLETLTDMYKKYGFIKNWKISWPNDTCIQYFNHHILWKWCRNGYGSVFISFITNTESIGQFIDKSTHKDSYKGREIEKIKCAIDFPKEKLIKKFKNHRILTFENP